MTSSEPVGEDGYEETHSRYNPGVMHYHPLFPHCRKTGAQVSTT